MWLNVITVIDIHTGNIASISRALRYLDVPHRISDKQADINSADTLIFPGVGSFSEASKRLKALGLGEALREKVIEDKAPILGICLGMQLFATSGEEGGVSEGLDLIKGRVLYHRASGQGLRLPHIGWNDVHYKDFKLFDDIANDSCFYFVHSYEFVPAEPVTSAYCEYGVRFVAAVQKDNIFGVQFHPEKSQAAGLRLLKNFCKDLK